MHGTIGGPRSLTYCCNWCTRATSIQNCTNVLLLFIYLYYYNYYTDGKRDSDLHYTFTHGHLVTDEVCIRETCRYTLAQPLQPFCRSIYIYIIQRIHMYTRTIRYVTSHQWLRVVMI